MARHLGAARGQTMYWHAWNGDTRTNSYINWVDAQMQARFGIAVEHVPQVRTRATRLI